MRLNGFSFSKLLDQLLHAAERVLHFLRRGIARAQRRMPGGAVLGGVDRAAARTAPRATRRSRARRRGGRAGAASSRRGAGASSRSARRALRRRTCGRARASAANSSRRCTVRQLSACCASLAQAGHSSGRAGVHAFICRAGRGGSARRGRPGRPTSASLHPAGARAVELVLRAALHQQQRTGVRADEVEGARADAGMVVERRGLRHAERLLRDAAGADRDLRAQLQRHAAVALLVVGPRHPAAWRTCPTAARCPRPSAARCASASAW